MKLLIDDMDDWLVKNPKMLAIIENVVKASLEEEAFNKKVEVSVTLTDNKTIKQINADHRNLNEITDVISFPQIDWEDHGLKLDYTNPAGEAIILGDIVISVDQLIHQAKEYHHSQERELGFLVAHSMFHLLGYDHMHADEEEKMIRKQEKVLENLGLVR